MDRDKLMCAVRRALSCGITDIVKPLDDIMAHISAQDGIIYEQQELLRKCEKLINKECACKYHEDSLLLDYLNYRVEKATPMDSERVQLAFKKDITARDSLRKGATEAIKLGRWKPYAKPTG